MTDSDDKLVTLGRVLGPWGVRGWVKIRSYTQPRENIVAFPEWILCRGGERRMERVEQGQPHGRDQVVAKLASIADRDAAAALAGTDIAVGRGALAPCEEGEYYWADLEGLQVQTEAGRALGRVDHLIATGSNDVLVVQGEKERLVPFVLMDVVKSVDLARGRIVVDWDPEF